VSGSSPFRSIVALSGGVGGARLVYGLARALEPTALTVIVNTGDDFVHWGLSVSPDLDTVMYTLAELSDDDRGWGLRDETFSTLERVKSYGGDSWFMLGDRDLATHLFRTAALSRGEPLSAITGELCRSLGVGQLILPMTDAPCPTMIDTAAHGTLPFQEWLVKHRAPAVTRVWFPHCPAPGPRVLEVIDRCDLVVIGPSNPYVSIDPILRLPGVRNAVVEKPVIAVSPIVGGKAVKGPLADMLPVLGSEGVSAGAVARHYAPLLRGFVVERGDESTVRDVRVCPTGTVMRSSEDRIRLARDILRFAEEIA
jgi:LPPG:FO 2-phospho-L-lactate transferase